MKTQLQPQSKTSTPTSSFTPAMSGLLQRKCACGNHTVAGGECAECAKEKTGLQRKLAIGANNDPLEREADRVADQVVANRTASSSVSSLAFGRIQREDAPKEKTNEEKYKEGLEKLGEAFLKTPLGKELLEKIKQDTLVKGATELGKDFISTWPGKIVTGAAATGAVAALAAAHKELPAQIPEIPLDVLTPGLSMQLTYKGPVDRPTEAMITFKFTEQAPKDRAAKKPMSETDKFRAETARLAAENAKFRAGMTYKLGSLEDLQQKEEQEAIRKAVLKFPGGPDIEATIKKYPWLATPEPKSGLQLTMPKPSFGIQPPSLLGDEFKLKLPGEQKKKQDEPALQRKLSIGASNDPLELEADRVAEQVMLAPAHPTASSAPLRIQRFTGQAVEGTDTAPASVDRVLASSGRPMEPALRQDMEQRFGHDFARVRVHSGGAAEQSAREVNANAYTVGHNIVFGVGRFAPWTHEGRRLIAHELTHVVQQSGTSGSSRGQSDGKHGLPPIAINVVAGRPAAALGHAPRSLARQVAKAAKKCPATHTIPDDIYKAIGDAWGKSGQAGAAVTEHGGRIVTDTGGKRVIRTGAGGGGSISLPAEEAGDTTLGTFHTHPYSKAEGSKLGVSFSGSDIKNFIAGGQGNVKYVEAGTCIYALDTLDATTRDGCKVVDIEKRWNDKFAAAGGNFQMKVDTAVRTAIAGCGLCYYGTCSPNAKSAVPKIAKLS